MNNFLTYNDLLTLGGAVLGVNIVTNGLGYAFGMPRKYVAFVVSFLISFATLLLHGNQIIADDWIVAFFNSFLIYTSSVGLNTVSSDKKAKVGHGVEEIDSNTRKFRDSWY